MIKSDIKLLVLVGVISTTLSIFTVGADTLTMATHDYTSDWHPIHATTYPVQMMTRLTTERLVEKACLGTDDKSVSRLRGKMTGRFLKICLSNRAYVQRKYINLKQIDQSHCSGLSVQDFQFTLEQIAKDFTNDYNYFNLKIKGNKLFVENPSPIQPRMVRQAISFPILRKPRDPNVSADHTFGQGSQDEYNALTHGRYKVKSFQTDLVRLQVPQNRFLNFNMTSISLKYFNQRSQLLKSMLGNGRVDVVLDLPTNMPINQTDYEAHATSELNNVSYVGFNFRTKKSELLDLYQNKRFRRLFTFSIWATDVIRRKLDLDDTTNNPEGTFYGESFEPGFRANTETPNNKSSINKIQEFLEDQQIDTLTQVILLIPPNISYLFTENQINEFARELSEMWQNDEGNGLELVLLNAGLPAQYQSYLESGEGEFDMVIETLFYGRNPYKAMALLLKDDPLNHLKNELIASSDIKNWLTQGPEGLESFRDRVLDTYPVAIIGSFPRRDYISTQIEIPKSSCPTQSVSIPYISIHNWKKK